MERLVANISGQVRRESLNGRDYLVAPLSLIVPGVLPGSQGPLYYPPDEVAKNPSAWDGMPLLAYHPQAQNGEQVSANHAGIVDKQGIGFVRKSHIDPLRKTLRGEGWFDVERTGQVDKRILDNLQANKSIELSTGLFIGRRNPAPPGANHNGQGYEWEARDYRPDHVAILPDQIGACSIRDGCGVLVNQLVFNNKPILKPGDHFEVVEIGGETLYRLLNYVKNDKFRRPENYDKVRDLPNNKELWAGANDWESGWTWAGVHDKADISRDRPNSDRGREPEKFLEISHENCPGCKGSLDAYKRKDRRACQDHSEAKVDGWLKGKSVSNYAAGQSPNPQAQAAAVAGAQAVGFDSGGAGTTPETTEPEEAGKGKAPKGGGGAEPKAAKEPKPPKIPKEAKEPGIVRPPAADSAAAASDVSAATPTATMNELNAFLLYNAKWDQGARDKLSKEAPEDFAGPHQSFPVRSQEDVDHAAHLIGHADDPEAVKSKVKAIAKRKGLSLPDSWKDSEPTGNSNKSALTQNGEIEMKPEDYDKLIANCKCEVTKNELQKKKAALVANAQTPPPVTNSPKSPKNMTDEELRDSHKQHQDEMTNRFAGGGGDNNNGDTSGDNVANDGPMHSFDGPKGSGKSDQAGGAGTKSEYPKPAQNAAAINKWLVEFKAPPAVRELISNAQRIDHETKLSLVQNMVRHVADDKVRNALGNRLMGKSLVELRELSMLSAPPSNSFDAPETPLYFGANAPAFNQQQSQEVPVENEFITPVLNFNDPKNGMTSPYLLKKLEESFGRAQ